MKHFLKYFFIFFLIGIVILCVTALVYEPAQCSICTQPSYELPCVINIATGDVTPFPDCSDQAGCGTAFLLNTPGAARLNPFVFCRTCRKKLPLFSPDGLVLGDLYDPAQSIIYPLAHSAVYTLRDFRINVHSSEHGGYSITVKGTLEQ